MSLYQQVVEQARCYGEDAELFFPQRGQNPRPAIAICHQCPVRQQCLELAMRLGVDGVWGGTTMRQRVALGGRYPETLVPWLEGACGTPEAAMQHRANRESCATCHVDWKPPPSDSRPRKRACAPKRERGRA